MWRPTRQTEPPGGISAGRPSTGRVVGSRTVTDGDVERPRSAGRMSLRHAGSYHRAMDNGPAPDRGAALVGPAAPELTSVEVDGRVSIYVPRSEQMLSLNDTASVIWRLATGEHSEAEILAVLAADYGVEAADIRADVHRTITRFRDEGLLVEHPHR